MGLPGGPQRWLPEKKLLAIHWCSSSESANFERGCKTQTLHVPGRANCYWAVSDPLLRVEHLRVKWNPPQNQLKAKKTKEPYGWEPARATGSPNGPTMIRILPERPNINSLGPGSIGNLRFPVVSRNPKKDQDTVPKSPQKG